MMPSLVAPEDAPTVTAGELSPDFKPRKVLMSPHLMDYLFTRDYEGNRLRVSWPEPDRDGFYTPVITVDYADPLRRP